MTPFAAALTAFEVTAIGPAIAAAIGWTRRTLTVEPVPPATEVHEAGHALLAWYCTAVAYILHVDTVKSGDGTPGGHVRAAWYVSAPQPAADWCRLVVALGGLAAEMLVVRRVSSMASASDLLDAAARCRAIVRAGGVSPPWPAPTAPGFPFESVFTDPLTEAELRVMRVGYATARDLLARHPAELARLIALLVERPFVRGEDLRPALGPRPLAAGDLWWVLGDAMRAGFSSG